MRLIHLVENTSPDMFSGFKPSGDDYISIDDAWKLTPVGLLWKLVPNSSDYRSFADAMMATVRARKFITDRYEKRLEAIEQTRTRMITQSGAEADREIPFTWPDSLSWEWEVEVSKHRKASAQI